MSTKHENKNKKTLRKCEKDAARAASSLYTKEVNACSTKFKAKEIKRNCGEYFGEKILAIINERGIILDSEHLDNVKKVYSITEDMLRSPNAKKYIAEIEKDERLAGITDNISFDEIFSENELTNYLFDPVSKLEIQGSLEDRYTAYGAIDPYEIIKAVMDYIKLKTGIDYNFKDEDKRKFYILGKEE